MPKTAEEDRILRVWTPILLRSILIAATIVLAIGLFLMATFAPGFYVERYRAVQAGRCIRPEEFVADHLGTLASESRMQS